ncbi:MAG: efflux RND transporter permease subunit, partial [Alphaproteobacteria bacterium]|nr:efflux RND transporter permease subunit [Alphaproteobacteria bacterium]
EDMLYMPSYATGDGLMSLTVTFKPGTNLDNAQVLVQNRVQIATPRLPDTVRQLGVVTQKSSPDLMMVVHMLSPDGTYDDLYISNYAILRVRDQLLRIDGIGDLMVFGAREYAIRVWLDSDRLASYGLAASDVVRALREQNVQVSGGALGTAPSQGASFQIPIVTQGRFEDPRQFGEVIVRAGGDGRIVRLRDVARVEMGAKEYVTNSYLNGKTAAALAGVQRPCPNPPAAAARSVSAMAEGKKGCT